MTPEGALKAAVIDYLNQAGVFYLRLQAGKVRVKRGFMHLCPEGTADFLIFRGSRILWCELKAKGQTTQKQRAEKQLAFRDKVLAEGHDHKVCYSVEDVQALVREGA